ncbi:MAG: ribosome small subunit-dependent GTPase A [Zetaproteobacteria bacterium CG_4_9_14_3_um_filter_49_83]|nr:MAG: ribosome small subunit-dependent GTPase A [Zetaproteobacteria bacterium CG1_02_49_23]PIQ30624.1 MAG: ribosome small subunit-dependent GTPase A [Zetaproteobacteria bacterium CG17_big_fil_post_rev_8_21_14_2_50_50_13]PIY56921.1 MAG: ribosome small subunit-dependent GTPase A [Zetaproteobacteria bacterium CG_4_10_14_0_8_um_filter_49_80]PJA35823.1 MAG: ribosome small subunit-dependent GTPase A [Zetaproteobacteria bacterium CG_4_9_14_3_um_filter_49_83]
MNELKSIGYSDWFQHRADDEKIAAHGIARVVSVHKDSYTVTNGGEEVFAELSGNLLYGTESASDLPTTGDWVYADFFDDDSHAIIYGVFPRKTLLKRKTAGKLVDVQLIAANIDVAFIMQSLNDNFNLRRLERYLVMVNESGIEPVVLLSKCDLLAEDDVNAFSNQVLAIAPQTRVMAFSNVNRENLDSIIGLLEAGNSYCLLGSSGVGKTTLLNSIIGHEVFETRPVSHMQSKGRHTTTTRQLVRLKNGAMIIDTPGMRELGSLSVDDGLDETFSEILALSQNCRFADCSHSNEKGCAILAAIEAGDLSGPRYQNYLKMKKESEFNQMSYLEKRKKDKNFGKMIKSTLKHKKKS